MNYNSLSMASFIVCVRIVPIVYGSTERKTTRLCSCNRATLYTNDRYSILTFVQINRRSQNTYYNITYIRHLIANLRKLNKSKRRVSRNRSEILAYLMDNDSLSNLFKTRRGAQSGGDTSSHEMPQNIEFDFAVEALAVY